VGKARDQQQDADSLTVGPTKGASNLNQLSDRVKWCVFLRLEQAINFCCMVGAFVRGTREEEQQST